VLEAAIELFAERGIEGTSIDAIAAASRVSKATIYKHWRDKHELCLEAVGRVHGLDRKPVKAESGDLLQDIIDFLQQKPPEDYAGLRDRLMPHLVAYAARDPQFGAAWRARVTEPGRARATELIQRGISQGVFPADVDIKLGLALLMGPMMFWHIFRSLGPAPDNLAEGVANAFWRAFAVPGARQKEAPGKQGKLTEKVKLHV